MKEYCTSEIPSIYWLHLLEHECNKCRRISRFYIPNFGDGVVGFESQVTHQVKWLPEYGRGGYQDLFDKLMPNFKGKIIPKVIEVFISELNKHIEKDEDDYFIIKDVQRKCVHCESKDLKELKEEVLTNPDLDWLRISCELIESESN